MRHIAVFIALALGVIALAIATASDCEIGPLQCGLLEFERSTTTFSSEKEADSGKYLERPTAVVYSYSVETGLLGVDSQHDGSESTGGETRGECNYIGNWTERSYSLNYGRCIAMRAYTRAVLYRFDIREVNPPEYFFYVDLSFKDADGLTISDTTQWLGIRCTTEGVLSIGSKAVRLCGRGPEEVEITDWPVDAKTFCAKARLVRWDATGRSEPYNPVEGGCHAL